MRRGLAMALALAAWAVTVPAVAQDVVTVKPIIGSAALDAQQETVSPAPVHMLVVGDGLGGGLGAGLMRLSEDGGTFDVTLRYNEESGIARPEIYDWGEALPKMIEGKDYDSIVVMMGANDRQAIRDGDNKSGFGSEDWARLYGAQVDHVLDSLMGYGGQVYWVGLPPMADPDYDAAMQKITAIQKAHAEAKGAHFIDIRPAFTTPDGQYTATGTTDTGEVRLFRASDGIGFYKQGNNHLAQVVLAAIASARTATPAPVAAAPKEDAPTAIAVAVPPAESDPPLFGQLALDGTEQNFRPDLRVAAAVSVAGSGGTPELVALSPPGSAAARLFGEGLAPAPKPGRADDFTMPR